MLLRVMDQLRTNTVAQVRQIRVSTADIIASSSSSLLLIASSSSR